VWEEPVSVLSHWLKGSLRSKLLNEVNIVGVENDESRLERPIYPFFLTKFAPSITSEGKLLSQEEYHPHTKKAVDFICLPFEYHDYTLQVRSPNEEFVPLKRRLKLEVNVGLEMDYILIGRDWQKEFDILFKAEEITIIDKCSVL
jgi:hypothetical protein